MAAMFKLDFISTIREKETVIKLELNVLLTALKNAWTRNIFNNAKSVELGGDYKCENRSQLSPNCQDLESRLAFFWWYF